MFFFCLFQNSSESPELEGEFEWQTDVQAYVLSAFFYGYVITQIPAGILGKTYGNIYFLGIGMLVNSVFGLLVPIAARMGLWWLLAVRFIQGLGEVSTVRSMASLGAGKDADPVTRKLVFALLPKFSSF